MNKIYFVIFAVLILSSLSFAVIIEMFPSYGYDTSSRDDTSNHVLNLSDLQKLKYDDNSRYVSVGLWWNRNYTDNDYIEFSNFTPKVPSDVQINSVKVYFEWLRVSSCPNLNHARLRMWNAGSWIDNELSIPPYGQDKLEIVDASSYWNTPEKLNDAKLWFQAKATQNPPGGRTKHDLVKIVVNYTVNCSMFSNEFECRAHDNVCIWCPSCSDHRWNGDGDKCVPKGECHRSCQIGHCGAECEDSEDYKVEDNMCYYECGDTCTFENNCSLENYCDGTIRYYNGSCSAAGCSFESEDCSQYDYYDDWEYYCSGDEVWRHRIYHEYSCSPDECQDNPYYTDEEKVEDCDDKDGWYYTNETRWVDYDQCREIEEVKREYRDYFCTNGGCDYSVTETRWVIADDTLRNKPDGTPCDDGLFCTVDDQCTNGECGGQPRSCDDGIGCTVDTCDEQSDQCVHTPDDSYCDDGLYCNGQEYCDPLSGCMDGTPVDCSSYNHEEIATCFWDPDGIDFTWDYAPPFESYCDEETDSCVEFNSSSITHECSVDLCNAECDSTHPCIDKCVGDYKYSSGVCLDDCTCSYNIEDCNLLDGWYTTNETRWVDIDQCNEKEQIKREYRDYTCSDDGTVFCTYTVTDEEWIDSGDTRTKPDNTPCDDGLFCTINDVCISGNCVGDENTCDDGVDCTIDSCDEQNDKCIHQPDDSVCDDGLYCNGQEYCDPSSGCQSGTPVDCSPYNLPEIATCNYSPDDNPYTWDYAPAFISYCDEDLDQCIEGVQNITHTCSFDCGAECESDSDCPSNSCSETYYDYCDGHKLVEYDNDKILDSTTVSDSCENTCDGCICTNCSVDCSAPQTHTYCVAGVCGAECDDQTSCEPKLDGDVCYFDGECSDDCECSYQTEECPEPGTVINDTCYWGRRSCTIDGCEINESYIRSCETCDPDIGPIDYDGPVVHDVSVSRVCKLINISAVVDDCSNIEEAEFFFDYCPPTDVRGEPLHAKDGSFDEPTEEVYANYVNIDTLSDGRHTLYIRAKDEHGNWGDCVGYAFNVDTFAPTTKWQNFPNFVCSNEPVNVNALICDLENESIIIDAEYLLDNFDVPNGFGVHMAPDDGAWDKSCEYVTGVVNVSSLSEGTHYIGIHGEDSFCNWGKIFNVSFIKDTTPPTTTKKVGSPKIRCDYTDNGEAEDCWLITQDTPITFNGQDYDPGDGEYSGNPVYGGYVKTYCRWRWKHDFDDEWSEWSEVKECNGIVALNEDSIHEVEYWSEDGCGNEESHHKEVLIVDTKPPVTDKEVGNPKVEGNGFTWITQNTPITLTCEDQQPHTSNNVTIYWRYAVDDQWGGWSEAGSSVTIKFNEDSNHTLEYYCVDALGNEEQHHVQYYKVDTEAPETEKTYGEPFYNNGTDDFATGETNITLTADDLGCSGGVGLNYTEYKIDDGSWKDYNGPFHITEEGRHIICFRSVDLLGNVEGTKCQDIIIDNTPPTTVKTISGDKCFNGTYDVIDSDSSIVLTSTDGGVIPVGVYKVFYRYCSGSEPCNGNWSEYSGPFHITNVADGLVRIEWYAVDYLGNVEDEKYEIDILDNTPPVTKIVLPKNGSTIATDFDVIINDTDACLENCSAKCYYRVNGGEWQERECNAPVHIDINETNYPGWCCEKYNMTIEAYAVDCLGHNGQADGETYIIDRFWPPEIVSASPFGTVETNNVTLMVETNKQSVCKFDVQSKSFEEMSYTMDTEDGFVHTYNVGLSDGYYVYYVRCKDMAGNKMLHSEAVAFYVNTAANYNLTIPRQGYFLPGWNYFVLPRIILNDIGVSDYSVDNVLVSLRNDGEWKYEVLFYYDGTQWRSYVPGEPANSLTEFIDNENRPYWIKIKQGVNDARIELR